MAIELAADQYGFVTNADLKNLGQDPSQLRQWLRRSKIDRVGHGIYRFRQIPRNKLDAFMLATLWPSGRGVLSHDTALELHNLCDINPAKIHLTIPPGYRPRRRGGEHYRFHYENLKENEIAWHEGIRIVKPRVAIRQALDSEVPMYLIRQALDTSARLGRIRKPDREALQNQLAAQQ